MTLEKNYRGRLFEDHVEEPRVFVAMQDNLQVGWIELGYEKWNNRMRVWEFLVKEKFRRKGIGMQLMKKAVNIAKERGGQNAGSGNADVSCSGNQFLSEIRVRTNRVRCYRIL